MLPKVWICGFNPFNLDPCEPLTEINLNNFFTPAATAASTIDACLIEITSTHAIVVTDNQLFSYSAVTEANHHHSFESKIVQLSACNWHCLVLLQCGDLFRYDIHEDRVAKLDFLNVERPVGGTASFEPEEPERITHIACGDQVSVAVTSRKAVFNIPSRTFTFPRHIRIAKVAVGLEHCLLLTANGDVYSWGGGLRGQLGSGEITPHREQPLLIEALAGVKIVDIAAGGWHSGAISSFGDVYCWGWNSHGQLGVPAKLVRGSVLSLPQLVDVAEENHDEISLERVYCGSGHTVVVCSKGELYFAGNDLLDRLDFTKIERSPKHDGFRKYLAESNIKDKTSLKCGANTVLFIEKANDANINE